MRRAGLVLAFLLAAGCATVERGAEPTPDWEQRAAAARELAGWRMTGRVAVVVGDDGGSAAVDWRQSGETADIALSGPLGVGALRAVLDPGGLVLEDAAGERLQGEAAEALLRQRLGMPVPLGQLRYWLLGAPAPGQPYQSLGRLEDGTPAFTQGGWTVGVGRFGQTPLGVLPTRLAVSRDGARLKLAVSQWNPPP